MYFVDNIIAMEFETVKDMRQFQPFLLIRTGVRYIRLNRVDNDPLHVLVLNCETNQPEFLQEYEYVERVSYYG